MRPATRKPKDTLGLALLLTLSLALVFSAGCSTSTLTRRVADNPLPKMHEFAKTKYNVEWNGTDRLRVTKFVNWGMLFLLMYDRYLGEFEYGDGVLKAEVAVENRPILLLGLLGLPHDLEPGAGAALIKPAGRRCTNELFVAAGLDPPFRQ